MRKYVARAYTPGFDDGDIEGPFYRYFYETDMRHAVKKVKHEHYQMFEGGLIKELFGTCPGILSLSVKPVRHSDWYILFDRTKKHYERALERYEEEIREFHKRFIIPPIQD